MQTLNHNFLRTAGLIQAKLAHQACEIDSLVLAEAPWRRVNSVARSVQLAHSRGWYLAARHQEEQLLREIEDLQTELARVSNELRQRLAPQTIPTQADLYWDLVALESEFEEVQGDLREHLLSVTTRPIVLEGIELGRFQIRLDWRLRQGSQTYTVVALDPNPAQSNDSVTHPHVSDEALCEGDGRRAIHTSLAAGRLYDFFTIVDRLLNTYAHGRAYVELDQWYGSPCHDCGGNVSEDDRYACNHCEENLCPNCATFCGQCDQVYCSGCSSACQLCDKPTCSSCLERCRSCGSLVCSDCLTQNLCTQCHETQSDEEQAEDLETFISQEPQSAVHSAGLGQITIPS
jgi:hypothetical protein